MNLLSLISHVLLISPCIVKCVQIVHNNRQFQRQQQLIKNISRFGEDSFATYFHRAQGSLFRLPFYWSKIDWVYNNFVEKGLIANIFFSKILVADDFRYVQYK